MTNASPLRLSHKIATELQTSRLNSFRNYIVIIHNNSPDADQLGPQLSISVDPARELTFYILSSNDALGVDTSILHRGVGSSGYENLYKCVRRGRVLREHPGVKFEREIRRIKRSSRMNTGVGDFGRFSFHAGSEPA